MAVICNKRYSHLKSYSYVLHAYTKRNDNARKRNHNHYCLIILRGTSTLRYTEYRFYCRQQLKLFRWKQKTSNYREKLKHTFTPRTVHINKHSILYNHVALLTFLQICKHAFASSFSYILNMCKHYAVSAVSSTHTFYQPCVPYVKKISWWCSGPQSAYNHMCNNNEFQRVI